jgi:nitrate/nitrite-specific signal transduction histidine kinase
MVPVPTLNDQKKSSQLLEEKVKERTRELESQKQELERSNANLKILPMPHLMI